jgi:hypothetical protein
MPPITEANRPVRVRRFSRDAPGAQPNTRLTFRVSVRRDLKRFDKPKSPNDKLVYFQSSDPGATDYQPADGHRADCHRAGRECTQCHCAKRQRWAAHRYGLARARCVGFSPHLASRAQVHGIVNAQSLEK